MDRFANHGGVHFEQMASTPEINRYVRNLPASDRDNLFEVLNKLDQAGLIKIMNDNLWTDGNGQLGGEQTDQLHQIEHDARTEGQFLTGGLRLGESRRD